MPRKPTAHAGLDQLRQQAAAERVHHRNHQTEIQATELEVEEASLAIADGYAAEDERAVTARREGKAAALSKLEDLHHSGFSAE
jgi:hypothetical protein